MLDKNGLPLQFPPSAFSAFAAAASMDPRAVWDARMAVYQNYQNAALAAASAHQHQMG